MLPAEAESDDSASSQEGIERTVAREKAALNRFRWLNDSPLLPAMDLRLQGWALAPVEATDDAEIVELAHRQAMPIGEWIRFTATVRHSARSMILLAGIEDSTERAQMLRLGFGDVLGSRFTVAEIESRALRLLRLESMLPRFRQIGLLRLDLLSREAFVDGEALGLHPREFALLWRLSEEPGRAFSKRRLIEDVWQMRFVPETNSLAVHVSRLRSKLRSVGISELLQTTSAGDYLLESSAAEKPNLRDGKTHSVRSEPTREDMHDAR